MASKANTTQYSQSLNPPLLVLSESAFDRPLPASSTVHSFLQNDRPLFSSHTWTSTSGDLGLLRDADEVENRAIFVQEYNRLAKKHGIRPLILDDFDPNKLDDSEKPKRGWFRRMFLSGSRPPSESRDGDSLRSRHRRSASDLAHLIHSRREAPSVLDLQSMVRLSGKSSLYLPSEYAPCAMILPTCIRATAQYVAQHANTRGIFRIPGSMKVVGALFDYYCHMDKGGADISGTVRSATLPLHIQYSVHDIASTLKRLLSTLPGGILGSLLLFDSFIAIQSQLNAEPEFPRTNQTKVRARLIALAIGTIESQYRRELICAIFGLLSMIGRMAEVAPREDEAGLPLPTTDLMGYGALSICFGPLLIGELLASYTMKIAAPDSGLVVLPPATQQIRKDMRKTRSGSSTRNVQPAVDKILIANRVTEMLISNWRDIVRQMKSLGTHRRRHTSGGSFSRPALRPSASETLLTKIPRDFSQLRPNSAVVTRNATEDVESGFAALDKPNNAPKRASGFLRQKASVNTLSPTIEESPRDARPRNGVVIEEGTEPGKRFTTIDPGSGQKADRSTMTEGMQTEMDSPMKRKRFTVPPRLSSIDSLNQPRPEATGRSQSCLSNKGDTAGNDENMLHPIQEPKIRGNSGQNTPPQFYSPVVSATGSIPPESPRKTPNGKREEDTGKFQADILEANTVSTRNGVESPATDSKYQLKRYKRRTYDPLTGSPGKGGNMRSPGKSDTLTFGPVRSSSIANTGSLPKSSKSSHAGSPVKVNPRKLRRARSGPLTNPTARKDDDVFSPNQRGSMGVWRNGVPQKSPTAKVLRSAVSDGVSLRASAIRSLINAKNRMKNSHVSNEKQMRYYNDDQESESWAKCSQQGLPIYEKPDSIIRHLNVCHGYNLPSELPQNSEAVIALYQIIISLHDKLIKQEMEVRMLQKGADDRRDEAGKLRQDVGMWRRRAESAEKRVLVFERFAERLKGIRDAAIASEQLESQNSEQRGEAPACNLKLDNDYVAAAARVRFAEVDGNEEQAIALEGADAEHRASTESRRSKTCRECGEGQNLDRRPVGRREEGGLRSRPSSIDEVAELWMAARELLDMDKDRDA